MLETLGFGYIAPATLLGLLVVAAMGAVIMGWITNGVMGDMGLGAIGNTILTLAGTFATLAVWNRVIGRVTAYEPTLVVTTIGGVVIALLCLVALLKRFT